MSSYKQRLYGIFVFSKTLLSHCKTFIRGTSEGKKKSSHVHFSNTQRQLNVSGPSWRPAVWEEKSGWPGREEPLAGRVCPSPPPAGGPAAGAELLSADRTDHSRSEPDSLQHWTWMIQKTHTHESSRWRGETSDLQLWLRACQPKHSACKIQTFSPHWIVTKITTMFPWQKWLLLWYQYKQNRNQYLMDLDKKKQSASQQVHQLQLRHICEAEIWFEDRSSEFKVVNI